MTIAATVTSVQYLRNGVTTQWGWPNKIFSAADLTIIDIDTSVPPAITPLVLGIDYTVQNVDVDSGCMVTTTLPGIAGHTLDVRSNISPVQSTSIKNQGSYLPELHEEFFDRITRELQDTKRLTYAFGIHGPDTESVPWPSLPSQFARANTNLGFDANGNLQVFQVLQSANISAPIIGAFITPPSTAELAAGVNVVNGWLPYGNVQRYGITPNSTGAAAANTSIFTTLVNASIAAGPTGLIYFPNNGAGSPDTYYFSSNAPAQIRDGITLDLNGCILNFSGAFNAAMNTYGFLTCIRDVTIQNGTIQVNYNGTGGVNNGSAIRIGSRSGYGFGAYPTGIFDQDDLVAHSLPLQGGVTLRNLRIKSNNPLAHIVFATGGLRNVNFQNVWLDGQGVCTYNGFYYEYGWSSTNGGGALSTWTSSHMTASVFRSIVISNLATGGTSQGFGFNGAYGCTVEDLNILTADQGMGFGSGESMFYRTWALDGSTQRTLTLRNIRIGNCAIGAVLGGAGPVGSGYLSAVINALAVPAQYQAQTDFLNYVLDGFAINTPAGTGIIATGHEVSILNGACNGGGIDIGGECIHSTLENVQIYAASGPNSLRYNLPGPIWSPVRPQFTTVRNCKIIGGAGVGIALANCQSAMIENNQIGANTLYDIAAETVQTNGVNLSTTSFGVRCRNNFVSTSGGAAAYFNPNATVDAGNSIEGERNLASLGAIAGGVTGGGGGWLTDFQSTSAQSIANGNTILVQNIKTVRLTTAGAVTGVIMAAGYASGHTVLLVNESGNSITFAASGTSRVAAGVAAAVAALTKMILVWDSSTNLWY